MYRIFVDLEMHPIDRKYKEERKICRSEIIEIGAVKYDEENKELDSFKAYVHMQYSERVRMKIQDLTGITTDMLRNAKILSEVLPTFVEWCGEEEYTIYSWSESDIIQILDETALKSIADTEGMRRMFRSWRDFQDDFDSMFHMPKQTSLGAALDAVGLGYSGRAHDALNDARSTAELYKCVYDEETYKAFKAKIEEAMKPHSFTMTDLFDFNSISSVDQS